MEQDKRKTSPHRKGKKDVEIVVKHAYVGDRDMREVFEKVAYENIRSKLKTG